MIRRLLLVLTTTCLLCSLSCDNELGSSYDDLDRFILERVEAGHIAGLSAALVKDGEVVCCGSYGYANIEQKLIVDKATTFKLASISKTITAVAIMQLWEQGKFNLDDDVNLYLPFSVRNPHYPVVPVTFRQLLTHTSSIRYNDPVIDGMYVLGDSPIPLSEYLPNYLCPGGDYYYPDENWWDFPPGTQFDYGTIGTALLGYLVERISGQPFNQYCDANIFIPLDMSDTSWFLTGVDLNRLAMPYTFDGDKYSPYGHTGCPNYPSVQLRTSAAHLGHFLLAFMNGGEFGGVRILQAATVELMRTPQIPDLNPGQGLIWVITTMGERTLIGHSGGQPGISTYMYYCPADNSGVIILCNSHPYNGGEQTGDPIQEIALELFDYALKL